MTTPIRLVVAALAAMGVLWIFVRAAMFQMTETDEKERRSKAIFVWRMAATVLIAMALARNDVYIQLGIGISLLLGLFYTYWRFAWGLTNYLLGNLGQSVHLALLLLLVWGWMFTELGVPDLIWHEVWWQRFISAVSTTFLLALLGTIAYYLISLDSEAIKKVTDYYKNESVNKSFAEWVHPRLEDDGGKFRDDPLHHFLWIAQFPFLLLMAAPALLPLLFPFVPRLEMVSEWWAYAVGLVVWVGGLLFGLLVVKLGLKVGEKLTGYTNPFADAVGEAARYAIGGFSDFLGWLRKWIAWLWGEVTRAWEWIAHQRSHGPAAIVGLPGASGKLTADAAKLVAGRQQQTRALFTFVASVILFYLAMNLYNAFGPDGFRIPPAPALFSLLALVAIITGLSRLLLHSELWVWRFPLFVAIFAWIGWANRSIDKLRFENMAYENFSKASLKERLSELYFPPPGGKAKGDGDGLVDDTEVRDAWLALRKKELKTGKPKLVVICCSGGGVRSLIWTSTVLEHLSAKFADFDESVRIITAGSAGAVGASYYIKAQYDDKPAMTRTPAGFRLPRRGWSSADYVPRDSESSVVRSIALGEIWRMFNAYPVGGAPPEDRGRVLEANWEQLRQVPFAEFREAERAGLIPSLIFEPVTLEDGRRLLISNLDLGAPFSGPGRGPRRGLVLSGGSELLFGHEAREEIAKRGGVAGGLIADLESGRDYYSDFRIPCAAAPPRALSDVATTNYSLTGIEYSRVFDRANGLRLATAARMSSALPMFTPAVYLPCDPPMRVIDSGFFDSYGIDVASAWLFENRDWLRSNTSGVLLVQIRSVSHENRVGVRPRPTGVVAVLLRGYQVIGSVVEGAANSFSSGAIFRNDREVAWLSELFNKNKGQEKPSSFFTTVIFENTAIARSHPADRPEAGADSNPARWEASFGATSWSLTEADSRSIGDGLPGAQPKGIQALGSGIDLIKCLRKKIAATEPWDENGRAALIWELERAENYERFDAMKKWWSEPQKYGDATPFR